MRLKTLLKAIYYLFYLILTSSVQAQPEMQIFYRVNQTEEVPITENMVINFNEVSHLWGEFHPYFSFVVRNLSSEKLTLKAPLKLSSPFYLWGFSTEADKKFSEISKEKEITIEAKKEVYFYINCYPCSSGHITVVDISDDLGRNLFKFYLITRTVNEITPKPKIQVFLEENGQELEIVDGSTVPIDFGTIPIYSEVTKYFTIRNVGKTKLDLTNLPPSLSRPFGLVMTFFLLALMLILKQNLQLQ